MVLEPSEDVAWSDLEERLNQLQAEVFFSTAGAGVVSGSTVLEGLE